jgi:hypothetical protein
MGCERERRLALAQLIAAVTSRLRDGARHFFVSFAAPVG